MPHGTTRIGQVAVFCGARTGHDARYAAAIRALGAGLASRRVGLIYGGGRVGLMGQLADAVLEAGGEVAGIIPGFLSAREIAHDRVSDLTVTDSMHSRKQAMFARADAFITMPGGLGTFDETIEVLTWRQLGLQDKPILIVDVAGWSRSLRAMLEDAVRDGFADAGTRDLYEVVPDADAALGWLDRARSGGEAAEAASLL